MGLTKNQKEVLTRLDEFSENLGKLIHDINSIDSRRYYELKTSEPILLATYSTLRLVLQVTTEFKRPCHLMSIYVSEERARRLNNAETAVRNLQRRVDAKIFVPDEGWSIAIDHLNAYARMVWLRDEKDLEYDNKRMELEKEVQQVELHQAIQ